MSLAGPSLDAPFDVSKLLERGLTTKPDEIALRSIDACWNWQELEEQSNRVAAHLMDHGLEPGDRVASLMPNRGELLIHYIACFKAGLVATPLNYRYQAPEIDHALEVSGASLLLFHTEREQDVMKCQLAKQLPLGPIRFATEDTTLPSFESFLETEPPPIRLPTIDRNAPAILYFTSGSTGKPKGVTHTQQTLGWMIASGMACLQMTPDDIVLPGSSLSHIGASLLSLIGLASGARVDIAHLTDGDELLKLLQMTRPTIMVMLPAALICLVREHAATANHFGSLRACFAGGDKVSPELEREFEELTGNTIDELYGMSEIGIATSNPPQGANKIGSVGRVADGYQASIRDSEQVEVPTGEQGKLWIKSPANMIGYWDRPDATRETIVDEWLDTGDIVKSDAEGYVWFCGRKKQIIVHDGSNICPQEVEDSLMEHPAIASAGVVGLHDVVHGEIVCAFVTLQAGSTQPTTAELIKFSRARVGYKSPEQIVILKDMPLNATGKVDRVTLKQMAEKIGPV